MATRTSANSWLAGDIVFSAGSVRKKSIALFLMRLPAFVPFIFLLPAWTSLNAKNTLTLTEADVLGTGGEIFFFLAVTITPMITLTGQRWIAPLRRWYGIMFAVVGIADAATAAITTDFAGGVFGRLAGHSFLLAGFLVILLALPLLVTANTPAQRMLGKYWKRLQRVTYVIWALIVVHLLLLDGIGTFGEADGDGDPVFHQRFYQAVAISIPLVILRLPPVRRWVTEQRAAGRQGRVWLAVMPLAVLFVVGFSYIINELIFTGTMAFTLHPPAD